jgi:hypothetical protein
MKCGLEDYTPSPVVMYSLYIGQELVALVMLGLLVHGYKTLLSVSFVGPLVIMHIAWCIYIIIGAIQTFSTDTIQDSFGWEIFRDEMIDVIALLFIRVLFRIQASTTYVLRSYNSEVEIRWQLRKAFILEVLFYIVSLTCSLSQDIYYFKSTLTKQWAAVLAVAFIVIAIPKFYYICYFLNLAKDNMKIFENSMNIDIF